MEDVIVGAPLAGALDGREALASYIGIMEGVIALDGREALARVST